jgi:hypothetical protein
MQIDDGVADRTLPTTYLRLVYQVTCSVTIG